MPKRKSTKRAVEHGVNLATMAASMPLATMVTLGHRLPMLFDAFGGSSWTNPELQRMASEKVQAAWQTSSAIGDSLLASQRALTDYAINQTSANLAIATTQPQHPGAIVQFGNDSLARLAKLSVKLGEIGFAGAAGGMKPAHRKVTANSKRLTNRAAAAKRR